MDSKYERGMIDFLALNLDREESDPAYWEGALAALSLNSMQFPDPQTGSLDVRPLHLHGDAEDHEFRGRGIKAALKAECRLNRWNSRIPITDQGGIDPHTFAQTTRRAIV